MNYKQFINLKYTIFSMNIIYFENFVSIKNTPNNFIALFLVWFSISAFPACQVVIQ